ncbi:LysE family transporter [uncultured Methanoregula sp.]|uniref:LysE family translocator n=1 Tax=uncultured Methanoregula sp. TaxID=1005933 RepID=UPI002AAB7078|nr:LysE family transporter [uncultured Methanoregula sp.]
MDASLFTQGIIIGLTLAVPVGPISLLCIQRAVAGGRLHGIISGIGVATADSLYAAVVFLGLTIVSGMIITHQLLFRFIACIVLFLVGAKVFLTRPPEAKLRPEQESYLKDYLTTVAISIANPLTILFFLAILPAFGVVFQGASHILAAEFVAGVFCGSVLWWIILCGSVGSLRSRLSADNLKRINQVSGIMIICIGAGMLALILLS